MSPSKARANEVEITPAYYERYCFIQVTCNMDTKGRHGMKIYEQ